MTKGTLLVLLLLALPAMARTKYLPQDDKLKTRAELTNYEETSRYEDVLQFIGELQKRTSLLRVETFGKTEEGRDLPLMIFADPPVAQPREALASGKAVIFIMANIHAGEVEGKEAVLHLSRRIAFGDLKPLLNNLVILIAPIYNADGNEKFAPTNRTAQHGPIGGVGTRENGKGLDLNRDYMKLESPEANALVALFSRWDPHLIVDLHTTNGSYHGYHLTYAPSLNPNVDARITAFARNQMLPAITRTVARKHKFRMYHYGNFATKERLNREMDNFEIQRAGQAAQPSATETKVWRTFDHRPRFGTNYGGLRNRLTILSEAYSYLDFKSRIAVTEAFVEEILNFSAAHAADIAALIRRVDTDAARGKLAQAGVEFELQAAAKPVNILVGAVEKKRNQRNNKDMTAMVESTAVPTPMLEYGTFGAKRSAAVPRAYVFKNEPGLQTVLAKLRAHGLTVETLTADQTIEVESFTITQVNQAARRFQGHAETKLKGTTKTESISFPVGSLLVRTAQPMAPLVFYLLDPESDDGLVNWNFLDSYLENGKVFPIFKLTAEVKTHSRVLLP